ncbi:hypothetical protein GCM10027589_26900 [Actinocorallia lasiicapitis]
MEAFSEFNENLLYAQRLVDGGRSLGHLRVGSFDVEDLYRAAWVQALAALDHWLKRELIDRAVALALRPEADRPRAFLKLEVTIEDFERIYHHGGSLEEVFRKRFESEWGARSFQNPDKIEGAFAFVLPQGKLWNGVAHVLSGAEKRGVRVDALVGELRRIAHRRNQIAHSSDRDPSSPTERRAMTADEAAHTIAFLGRLGHGIATALGPIPVADFDTPPEDIGAPSEDRVLARPEGAKHWDEASVLNAIRIYCKPDLAAGLMKIYRHSLAHPAFVGPPYWGDGAHPSATLWFQLGEEWAAVWSVYTAPHRTVLSINFAWMRNRGFPAERLDRLAATLSVLPGLGHLPATVRSVDYAKRPSLGPETLTAPDAPEIIITALDDLLSEA